MVEYTCDEGFGVGEDLNMSECCHNMINYLFFFLNHHFSFILVTTITFY